MVQLKAGHGPAQRVGNMRVKVTKRNSSKDRSRKPSECEEFDELSSSPKQQLVVSGAVVKGDTEFQADAIRAYHDKVHSHFDLRPQYKSNVIQQPKKM